MKKTLSLCASLFATLLLASPEELIKQLASDSPADRDLAYQQLLPSVQPEQIPLLNPMLQQPVSFDTALSLLEAMKHPSADQAIAQSLEKAAGAKEKTALLNVLSRRHYAGSLAFAKTLLRDGNADVASAALHYCARTGDAATLQALTSEKNCPADLQLLIAERLTVLAPTAAIVGYAKLAEDKAAPDHLRLAALRALILLDEKQQQKWIVMGLSSDSEVWRGSTAQVASQVSPDTIARVMKTLPAAGRLPLLTAVAKTGKKENGALFRSVLASEVSAEERLIAVQGLGETGDAKDVPTLIKFMGSDQPQLAETARISLGKLSDQAANKAIAKQLDAVKPELAVKLLGLLATRQATGVSDSVADMLEHASPEVRIAAYQALTVLATDAHVKAIIKQAAPLTEAQEQQAAERTIMAVARSYPKDAVSAMSSRFSKADANMKAIFIRATGVADIKEGLALLKQALAEKDPTITDEAVRVLAAWKHPSASPQLERLLADYPNPRLRTLALRGFIRLIPEEPNSEERARQCAIATKLATRPEEKPLLIDAYGSVAKPESVSALKAFLSDETLKKDVVRALRKIAQTLPVDAPDVAPGSWIGKVAFEAKRISNHRSEACNVADFNGDGKLDICAGPFIYLAPDWKPIKIREVSSDVKEDGKGYADDFCNLILDVNGDGKPDILSAGWFSKTSFWFENTLGKEGLWPVHTIEKLGNHETGLLVDITGDGKAEEFMPVAREAVWYERTETTKGVPEFKKYVITNKPMTLGLGTGDINGDGRPDAIYPTAWFQAPENLRTGTWIEHPIALGGKSNTVDHISNAIVFDMNKDGLNDIITSTAHKHGIWWYEQKRDAAGTISWIQHTIDDTWSQAHYLLLADIDNDGKSELITGKRFMAHNGNDPDERGIQCVYYYTFTPGANPVFRKHVITYDEGISAGLSIIGVDIDKDGDLDLVTTGKWGGPVIFENQLIGRGMR
jgi:HEAT repeat protein